jgi:MOSC domain-containing protein YiiM
MTRSLLGRGGICVRVIEDGSVGEGDEIVVAAPRA